MHLGEALSIAGAAMICDRAPGERPGVSDLIDVVVVELRAGREVGVRDARIVHDGDVLELGEDAPDDVVVDGEGLVEGEGGVPGREEGGRVEHGARKHEPWPSIHILSIRRIAQLLPNHNLLPRVILLGQPDEILEMEEGIIHSAIKPLHIRILLTLPPLQHHLILTPQAIIVRIRTSRVHEIGNDDIWGLNCRIA